MYSFCPHCGLSIDQQQTAGKMLTCIHCKKDIGLITVRKQEQEVIDQTEQLLKGGDVARCPLCQQIVQIKKSPTTSFATHFTVSGPRKVCPQSGKPIPSAAPAAASSPNPHRMPGGKDLSAFYKKDVIRVVLCKADSATTLEDLTLEYLDRNDRVRIQIEALRELLGTFQMKPYPAGLNRPELGLWGNASSCVIAKKHPQGGIQPLAEAEIAQVLGDLKSQKQAFFR